MQANGEIRSDFFPRSYPFSFCERCRFPEVDARVLTKAKSKINLLISTVSKQNNDRLVGQDEVTNLFFFRFALIS